MYFFTILIASSIAQNEANNTRPLSKLVQVSNSIVGKSIMLQLELLMLLFVCVEKSHTGMTAIVVQFIKINERQMIERPIPGWHWHRRNITNISR